MNSECKIDSKGKPSRFSKFLKIAGPSLLAITLILIADSAAFAQSGIETEINKWANEIKTIMNALTGAFAVIGAFILFTQYMQGNQEAQKNLIKYITGLAIMGLATTLVSYFITTPTP